MEIVLEENIEKAIWYKLLVNLGINSVTAVSHQPASVMRFPQIAELCRLLLEEGLRVARAYGLNFEDDIVDKILDIYKGYPDEMGTSMYYDITGGRPLEVKAIQGYIYHVAREYKVETPHLDTIYAILSAYQQQIMEN